MPVRRNYEQKEITYRIDGDDFRSSKFNCL